MVEAAKLIHTYVNTSVQPRKDKSGNFKWNSLSSDSEGTTCMVWGSCAVQQSLRATKSALFSICVSYFIALLDSCSIFSQFYLLTSPSSHNCQWSSSSCSYWHHNKRGWVPFWLRAVGVPSPKFPGYLPPLLAGAVRCPLPSLGHEKGLCVPQEWDVSIAEHFPAQPCTVCSHPFPGGATCKKTFPGRGTVPRQQLGLDLVGGFFPYLCASAPEDMNIGKVGSCSQVSGVQAV